MDWIDKLIDREDLKETARELAAILESKGLTEYEKHFVLRSLDSALEYNSLFGGKGTAV